jgi:hypothetical protein
MSTRIILFVLGKQVKTVSVSPTMASETVWDTALYSRLSSLVSILVNRCAALYRTRRISARFSEGNEAEINQFRSDISPMMVSNLQEQVAELGFSRCVSFHNLIAHFPSLSLCSLNLFASPLSLGHFISQKQSLGGGEDNHTLLSLMRGVLTQHFIWSTPALTHTTYGVVLLLVPTDSTLTWSIYYESS